MSHVPKVQECPYVPLVDGVPLYRAVAPEEYRVIQAGQVHMINLNFVPPAGVAVAPPVTEYAVHLALRTPPLIQVGFNRAPRSPGVILAAPPNTAGDFISDDASHVLTMMIPKACVDDFTQDSGLLVEIRREETFREPRLMRRFVRLWNELADDAPAGGLFADQLMGEVLHTLAARTSAQRPSPRHARERISAPILRRLRDYVESSLAEDLNVVMMASVAGMSPAHFSRALAATVGMTPFRYVMTRRLARAHELLQRTRRSVLGIALDVGFKTPSHFTSRFRREFGVTRARDPFGLAR
jgi:AraC-like DNA-binding protein